MLNENIKSLRKSKGITQDELAIRLNVVRQTISKWEKGLSVPDAEMLQRMADIFEVTVSQLLGSTINQHENVDIVSEQLSRINEQLVIRNNRTRKIWKTIGIIFAVLIAIQIILIVTGITVYKNTETYEEYIEEFPNL